MTPNADQLETFITNNHIHNLPDGYSIHGNTVQLTLYYRETPVSLSYPNTYLSYSALIRCAWQTAIGLSIQYFLRGYENIPYIITTEIKQEIHTTENEI